MRQFGLKFEETRLPLGTERFGREIKRYSPAGLVPVLCDRSLKVWDSLAICEYVSERHLNGSGWPEDADIRALARSASAEMHSGFLNVRSQMPLDCRNRYESFAIPEAVQREIERIRELWRSCREQYGRTGPWLFGNFSIADAMYAPVVLRFNTYRVKLEGLEEEYGGFVLENEHIRKWMEEAEREKEVIK